MRFSTRLPDSFNQNSLATLLDQLKRASVPLLDLTISNPTVCGIDYPRDAIVSALTDQQLFNYKPDPKGMEITRIAISETHGHNINPEHIQLTASTSEAYSMLFKLLANPGDNILVPSPSYPLFEWLLRLEGLRCKAVPAFWHDGWNLDMNAIYRACDSRTRAIVVVNPNNPTGQFLTETEWLNLLELAARKDLSLIVDEVFACYKLEHQNDAVRTVMEGPTPECSVFLLSGLSKTAVLPQLKLAWIVMLGTANSAAEPLAFIADQYLSVSATTAYAAPQLLALAPKLQNQVKSRLIKNLMTLDNILKEHPHLGRHPVYGGWSVLIQRPAIEDDESCVLRLLSDSHVLIYPGHFFDIPKKGFLVASLLPETSYFEQAITVLAESIRL
jgi:aspartate/methionine/tyrosine aminotransferase